MQLATSRQQAEGAVGDWRAALAAHERWLRTVVLARVREVQAVDEVLQEVWLAAAPERWPADRTKLAPWLYRIAVTQALLYRRRAGRSRKLLTRYADRQRPADGDSGDPLLWLLTEERRSLVRTALAQLPPRDAEILLLKYTEQWSYKELAARLGVTSSAVEARLHRARARLRAALLAMHVIEVE